MSMSVRENFAAIMHGEDYDAMPILNVSFWTQTLWNWEEQGYLRKGLCREWCTYNGTRPLPSS